MSENQVPRRNQLNLNTAEELAIYELVQQIEKLPADVRLTNVIIKLAEAKALLADYIDGIEIVAETDIPQPTVLTLGQKRVLKSFNPSNNQTVERLKDLGAEMIDIVQSLRGDTNSDGKSQEGQRSISLAQTEIEIATMCAVKAVFVE